MDFLNYSTTMSRNLFIKIIKHSKFDDKHSRLKTGPNADRLAPIRKVSKVFVSLCQKKYVIQMLFYYFHAKKAGKIWELSFRFLPMYKKICCHRRTQGGVSGVKTPLEEWCSAVYTCTW